MALMQSAQLEEDTANKANSSASQSESLSSWFRGVEVGLPDIPAPDAVRGLEKIDS